MEGVGGVFSLFILKGTGKLFCKRTPRVWPNDHLIRRLISLLNKKPEATAPGNGRMTLEAIQRRLGLSLLS